jgi:uncharacterized membrane protein YdjX (TVP38/TMEM64 family)
MERFCDSPVRTRPDQGASIPPSTHNHRLMRRIAGLLVLGAALLTGLWALGRFAGEPALELVQRIGDMGAAAPILFIVVYILATVALVPGSLLTLAAGAMFGVWRGTLIVFVGAVVGATLAFLIARHLARPAVERRLGRDPRFARIDSAVGREGGKIVLLLRLTPVLPFNLLNYGLGITRVRFRDYVFASVGMLPGTILYVYSGRVIGEITAIAAGVGVERGPGSWAVLVLGLVATLALVVVITRIARRALAEDDLDTPDPGASSAPSSDPETASPRS